MEQTLGKRIVENRKRIGLTQDQLAEQLGVTAQAVSKWENDQSCPDIALLPKLANIFGITTDALLGREEPQPVYEAEVVDGDGSDIHVHTNNWEFKWDAGKKETLTFAILVLLVGGLTLLAKIQSWDVSFWSILWPSTLLVYGVRGLLSKFSFFGLGCALFGGYYLISNLNIWEIHIGSEFVFPIIVVLFGLSLLVDALRRPKKPRFHISRNGVKLKGSEKTESSCTTDNDSFAVNLSFGEDSHYIVLDTLRNGEINCSFGELTVDLTGCKQVKADCSIDANCSFGELQLLVPKCYCVKLDQSSAFGDIKMIGQPDPNPAAEITLDANVSFGEIKIRYI